MCETSRAHRQGVPPVLGPKIDFRFASDSGTQQVRNFRSRGIRKRRKKTRLIFCSCLLTTAAAARRGGEKLAGWAFFPDARLYGRGSSVKKLKTFRAKPAVKLGRARGEVTERSPRKIGTEIFALSRLGTRCVIIGRVRYPEPGASLRESRPRLALANYAGKLGEAAKLPYHHHYQQQQQQQQRAK